MEVKERIFDIKSQEEFKTLALKIFKFQFENNWVYRSFCDLLYIHPADVFEVEAIPFLPITFFKSHEVLSQPQPVETIFTSSGTTGSITSKHLVTDLSIYKESYRRTFEHFYGNIKDYTILALLPSYLERDGSSLIYMVQDLIKATKKPESGFYLNNFEDLAQKLRELESKQRKTLLIGVSFALLDFVAQYQFNLKHTIVMETGGMKGRKQEIIRQDLHQQLEQGFGVTKIHSEYGMTELLSQAYSVGNGLFKCPPWMQLITRDPEDALTMLPNGKVGGLNIIDLANVNSCAFIATQDLGKTYEDGSFEVLGRYDHSDIRGCNLMAL